MRNNAKVSWQKILTVLKRHKVGATVFRDIMEGVERPVKIGRADVKEIRRRLSVDGLAVLKAKPSGFYFVSKARVTIKETRGGFQKKPTAAAP